MIPAILSLCTHAALAGMLLWTGRRTAPHIEVRKIGPLYAEIVIDQKRYFVTPLAPPSLSAPRPAAQRTAQPTADAAGSSGSEATIGRPVPPGVKPDPHRLNTLLQADLRTPPTTAGEDLPSFQVVTGRLAPYRRQFIMPGSRPVPAARSIELNAAPPTLTPQIAPAIEMPQEAKLTLSPAPSISDVTLPATDQPNPNVDPGKALNVVSTNPRAVTAPEHLLLPPNQFVGRSGNSDVATTGSRSTIPSSSAGIGGESTAIQASKSERREPPPASPGDAPVVFERSPEGKFDSIVVQSSPLEQFPGGSTLLHCRPIFTVYVPMGTGKDWAMFFCTNSSTANTGNAAFEPPYPFKLVRPRVNIPVYQKYVLVHGFVSEEGATRDVRPLPPVSKDTSTQLLEAFSKWIFRPARHQGSPMPAEFVIAVPAGTF